MNFKLETNRLTLIPFKNSDKTLFHKLNTDTFVRKYLWDDEIIEKRKSRRNN